jgi:hypothetical protein
VKPGEARRRRKAREEQAQVYGEKLEAFLRSGEPQDLPTPHLVPTAADKVATLREYRRLARLAAGERAEKRDRLLDRAIVELARLVWIERVLGLEPLERAGLTPARLVALSVVDRAAIRARFNALQGVAEDVAEVVAP